jgi:16S rRNA (cytidine1402-2'-O)-methyltransferase
LIKENKAMNNISENQGTLYIVGTPIGNLEDITLRALATLKAVDVVLCEDTRVTRKLLNRFEISKPTLSFHEHSDSRKFDTILEKLARGENLALVTDAGTPGVSDPGNALVSAVRTAGMAVVPIPGVAALSCQWQEQI